MAAVALYGYILVCVVFGTVVKQSTALNHENISSGYIKTVSNVLIFLQTTGLFSKGSPSRSTVTSLQ